MIISRAAWEDAGMEIPRPRLTWEEFDDRCEKLTAATKRPRFYGCADTGGLESAFETWLRQRAKSLYTEHGRPGFDEKDAAEWVRLLGRYARMWGLCSGRYPALDQLTIAINPLPRGRAAACFANSNQLVGYQAINEDLSSMGPYLMKPGSSRPGQCLKPTMMFSVAGNTESLQAAGEFVSFFVNNPGVARILGAERGVPGSERIRQLLLKTGTGEGERIQIQYIALLGERFAGPFSPPPPKGAGEIQLTIKRKNEEVGFKALSPEEAGVAFVDDAAAALERSRAS